MDDFVGIGPIHSILSIFDDLGKALNMGSRASLREPGDQARVLGTIVQ